ncbi:ECF transporter S component (folate family) [Clostridium saccharoperbutylacetonicum]|uniref:Folate transporter FolT n=1 Tax=Clostridium saccharoperbutylacetonicum N1-4(HMT) TaxID=931276 RepID=M1MTJ5_9CLOT|nr:folate family ECF transporter S component [Clostridium saccharoperbutylacetonicum]AGF58036.1 hypothetical protein DUF3816 [Clostridium saccharoperbutylacetonicum N1-4(HMT)]NRT61190.1 ECF transporter S component (folate family) [Clostridium saccharoperbutylacetonicum]NSB24507.1 ECF transporter S component (folate family) [Clostridium saccharoperbutylacetonicum]NSB43881.1 ECF transporter S component (folate family) [Clostridium saccharoperbutylacetonicum]
MKNYYELFLGSTRELRNVKNLVIVALLMGASFIVNFFTIQITPVLRLSLGFVVSSLIGMLFGPAVGGLCGGLSDIINYIIKPTGPFFPGFTISGILVGILYGIALYNKKITIKRCAIITIIITVLIDIFLNTYWLVLLYGKGFGAVLPLRVVTNIIFIPIKTAIMYFVLNLIIRIKKYI